MYVKRSCCLTDRMRMTTTMMTMTCRMRTRMTTTTMTHSQLSEPPSLSVEAPAAAGVFTITCPWVAPLAEVAPLEKVAVEVAPSGLAPPAGRLVNSNYYIKSICDTEVHQLSRPGIYIG